MLRDVLYATSRIVFALCGAAVFIFAEQWWFMGILAFAIALDSHACDCK
jgi:hypothetical protein